MRRRVTRAAWTIVGGFAALCTIACTKPLTTRAHAVEPAIAPLISEAEIDREVADRLAKPVDYAAWRPMAGSAMYLAPRADFIDDDGGFDVIVHFHGGMLAEKEWRKSGTNAVLVSAAYAQSGTGPYRDAFADPNRFAAMLKDLTQRVHATHVRRLALVSWSAGYAATDMLLRDARYYAMIDTVVLLDSLHADYTYDHAVDTSTLEGFIRFAEDAADGKKTMAVVHSSIIPPDYASTTETAAVLCEAAGAERVVEARTNDRGMTERYHADRGNLHVRGYRGEGPKDHMNQLFLVGSVAREHIVARWARLEAIERRAIAARRGAGPTQASATPINATGRRGDADD